jgi:hypothetical protein
MTKVSKNQKQSVNTETAIDGYTVSPAVTSEMKKFAQEYSLWTITYGQVYLNALSPNFTMDDPMEIFLSKYYGKNWVNGLVK